MIIVNEEGKLIELEGNRRYGNDILVGNIVIAGADSEGEFISLTKEQINRYIELFYEPEEIRQDEVQNRFIC